MAIRYLRYSRARVASRLLALSQIPGKKISAVSVYFETLPYRLDPATGYINYEKMEELGARCFSNSFFVEMLMRFAHVHVFLCMCVHAYANVNVSCCQ